MKSADLTKKKLGLATSMLCTIVGQRKLIMKNVHHSGLNVKQAKTLQHTKLEVLTLFEAPAAVNIDG